MELLLPEVTIVPSKNRPEREPKIKVFSPSQILNKQRVLYPFKGRFQDSFGTPEKIAKWFITGPSFSGKSSLVAGLCNYLTEFGIIDYNNFEEAGGDSETVAEKIRQYGLGDKDGKIRFFKTPIPRFKNRLMKRKSACFGVIDSIQHSEMDREEYIDFTDTLCNQKKGKSLLFISHWVKNDYTKFIKHDCDVKVEVIGFVAHVESRYGGNKPFIIWEEGAKKHWGKRYQQVIKGQYWPGQKK
jgi:hypothetical protein